MSEFLSTISQRGSFGRFEIGAPGTVFQDGNPIDFTIAEAVPEPASLGLVVFGFAATAWLARRRHHDHRA